MDGLAPPGDGPQASESQLDFQPENTVYTPLGLQVTKKERPDLPGGVNEVRISFLVGLPPGIVTKQLTVRLEEQQARELATLLTGGIHLAKANEVPS